MAGNGTILRDRQKCRMVLTRDGENANLTIHDVLDIPIMDACPCNHPDPTYNGVLNVFEMQRGISNLISSCLARLNKLVSLYLFRVLVFSFFTFHGSSSN